MKPQSIILKYALFILVLCSVSLECLAEKIGFVDMERLINSSPQIKKAQETITSEFELQYSDIEQKESDLKVLEDRITKNGAIMTIEELSKLQERARILERQLRRAKEDLKDAITIRNNQIYFKIQDQLNAMVKQYAIDNNYDAILINSILYVSESMDITQEIVQLLKSKSNNEN